MDDKNKGAGQSADSNVPASGASGYKISEEMAAQEFAKYCDANDIDHDETAMNEEELKDFSAIKRRFIKACRQGRVEVDGRNIVYTNSNFSPAGFAGQRVTITRPGGTAFSGMDGFKESQQVHKLHAFCSAMTGQEVKYFSKLDIVDWQFYRDIATLFLAG